MGAFEFQNTSPIAVDDSGTHFTTDPETPFWTTSVLLNDTDPNSDILQVVSFDDSGILGTIAHLGYGIFSYDPNSQFDLLAPGEQATDTFTYTASDGNDGSDTATVTITIIGKAEESNCTCLFLPQVMEEE
jgi:VCBS repeat-containing protein